MWVTIIVSQKNGKIIHGENVIWCRIDSESWVCGNSHLNRPEVHSHGFLILFRVAEILSSVLMNTVNIVLTLGSLSVLKQDPKGELAEKCQ
jgi:hypothetical protein